MGRISDASSVEMSDEMDAARYIRYIQPLSPDEDTQDVTDVTDENTTEPAAPTKKQRAAKKSAFIWKDEVVFFLINMWRQEPVLFNIRDSDYSNKNKRSAALERIVDSIKNEKFDTVPTKVDVQEKMASLRVYFNVQKTKSMHRKGPGQARARCINRPGNSMMSWSSCVTWSRRGGRIRM